jgi:hypothetical protein
MVPTGASDWESRKQIIRELYVEQNMILNEVIEIMITKYKFKATYVISPTQTTKATLLTQQMLSARMYKGQFAKWKWTKYNKTGKPGAITPAKSRVSKKKSLAARRSPVSTETRQLTPTQNPLSQHIYLQYFSDEEWQVETTLNAYAALISNWCERETPWKTAQPCSPSNSSDPLDPQHHSILQHVRAAQDHFLQGHPHHGGDMLRRAFLGIETALESSAGGGLGVEALWDCCLAVPQLALTTGWTDILAIFARYLHQYTSIKLSAHHPITKVAAALHSLSRSQPTTTPTGTAHRQLEAFVSRAWSLWVDCVTRVRGRHDDVTIHLKRGYVTLVDPSHAMAGDILADFGLAVQESLRKRGAFATTSRILELENLLVRMYVPLFTAQSACGVVGFCRGFAWRFEGMSGNRGRGVGEWDYMDRYLVFSANYFMASITEYGEEGEKAALYRWRSLDSPRDLFWVQTSLLVEARMRADGHEVEADRIQEARVDAQCALQAMGQGEIGI